MDEVGNYWINSDPCTKASVPNVSLFRFVGSLFDSVQGKRVLEIGFLDGADLLEFKKRGANIYGLDINPIAVSKINLADKKTIKVSRCGVDPIPFDESFDLIYSRDTIYYLTDEEIKFFFHDASKKINNEGVILIQFIESDLYVEKHDPLEGINFIKFSDAKLKPIFQKDNPIRFLLSRKLIKNAEDANLSLIASKRMLQSYDLHEEKYRLDRYLAFKKM